jgi:hypothetical protein
LIFGFFPPGTEVPGGFVFYISQQIYKEKNLDLQFQNSLTFKKNQPTFWPKPID